MTATPKPPEPGPGTYQELLARYRELELRVTRFSSVEQRLVRAQDRLDREVAIHGRMHRFNTAAFKEMEPSDFARLVAESLVDIFEVELGLCGTVPDAEVAGGWIESAAHGTGLGHGELEEVFRVLEGLGTGGAPEWVRVLSGSQLGVLAPWIGLRHGMAVVLRDEQGRALLWLLAGNTEERAAFYEPVPPDRADALLAFAQQAASHLANQRSRRTIRRQVELIRRSEERLRLLGDNLPGGLVYQIEVEPGGRRRFLYVSAGIVRIHKVTAEEALADAEVVLRQIVDEDRPLLEWREIEAITHRRPFSAEVRIRNAGGELRWILMHAAFTPLDGGRIRWDGLSLDISDRKRLEERLQQSQKMEGIGHLAGGIAHEFNNLLAAMTMSLGLARHGEMNEDTRGLLGEIDGLCTRAANLVRQLLAFSRQSVMTPEPVRLEALVGGECRMLERLLGEHVRIELAVESPLPRVKADRGMLAQVLLNLCLNARDAMPDGGVVRLHLGAIELGATPEGEALEVYPGRYVCLSVSDTGCGMDERTRQRLFEPFFTTKAVGRGTGLGLATVRGIVQQHRGTLSVESRPGHGSTFRILLPALSDEDCPEPEPGPAAPKVPPMTAPGSESQGGGRATVLMVEDEPAIRRSTGRLLRLLGYTVLEAGTAAEALAVWHRHGEAVDLLFTDMVMPGEMTGLQLAERVAAERPGTQVILTTGYNPEVVLASRTSGIPITVIPKPCPPDELAQLFRRLLSGPSAPNPGNP